MVLPLPNVKAVQRRELSGDVMQCLAAMLNFLCSWKHRGRFQVYKITMSTFRAQKTYLLDASRWRQTWLFLCLQTKAGLEGLFKAVSSLFRRLSGNLWEVSDKRQSWQMWFRTAFFFPVSVCRGSYSANCFMSCGRIWNRLCSMLVT